MRNRMFTREDMPMMFAGNFSCCECNLCTMYACPEGLDPRGATVMEKRMFRDRQMHWDGVHQGVHPLNDYRKVPTSKLMQRLDVVRYDVDGPLTEMNIHPATVRVPLAQHLGAPAVAVVVPGDAVKKYDRIAKAGGTVSSTVHASIDGTVTRVSTLEIVIERDRQITV
jgi:Na+-translocating ferredoxin:NAD+ oxidoreductase RnfC subunit